MAIKFFSWTPRQKRKKRTQERRLNFCSVPKYYVTMFRRTARRSNATHLKTYLKTDDEKVLDNLSESHRHSALWEYW